MADDSDIRGPQAHSQGRSMSMLRYRSKSRSRSRSSSQDSFRRRSFSTRRYSRQLSYSKSARRGRSRSSSFDERRGRRGRSPAYSRSWSRSRSRSMSRSHSRYRSGSRSRTKYQGFQVVVRNLSRVLHFGHVREIFGSYGPILYVDFSKNRRSCTITFRHRAHAKDCYFCMDGGMIDRKIISVSQVLPLDKHRPASSRSPSLPSDTVRRYRNWSRGERLWPGSPDYWGKDQGRSRSRCRSFSRSPSRSPSRRRRPSRTPGRNGRGSPSPRRGRSWSKNSGRSRSASVRSTSPERRLSEDKRTCCKYTSFKREVQMDY